MIAEIDGNTIKLYGTIWQGEAPYIIKQISSLLKSKSDLTIHLHTPGGSVIDGNLIFNELAKAKANITIVVDGLAASMGSILMLCGHTIKMAENAFVMIHAPSGSEYGNAKAFEQTAKVLRSMESSFLKKLSARTGKSDSEINDWMNGDNWFSAEEAKAEGLIDEILDPIMDDQSISAYGDKEVVAQLFTDKKFVAQLFAEYDAKQGEDGVSNREEPKEKKEKLKPTPDMKIEAKAIEALGLKPDATEAEINAAITKQSERNAELTAKLTQENDAKATKLVEEAVAAGKIPAADKDMWISDAKANYDSVKRMIALLPEKKNLSSREKPDTNNTVAQGREGWKMIDWMKKDLTGLHKMRDEDPEAYQALVDKK